MNTIAHNIAALLGRKELEALTPLGEGGEHIAYEVDNEFIVRARKCVDATTPASVDREIRLLAIVADTSPIPVPEVVAASAEQGLLVLRKLPGTSLLDAPCADAAHLVDSLAAFLSHLHALPIAAMQQVVGADDYPTSAWWSDAAEDAPHILPHLSGDDRRMVERFLGDWPPAQSDARMLCHNDLGAEHLLAANDGRQLTGVIDWSDAALTDPARDLGRIYRDFGPATARAVVGKLATHVDDAVLVRAAFYARCCLLEDLIYGLRTPQRRYFERALANLPRTFAADETYS